MKIVIDSKIPMITGVFEPYAEVCYLPGALITPADVADADALITRTRTRCSAELLSEALKLKIIATATIGFDHIDTAYCADRGIRVATSAGCNARAVAQWVFAALGAMRLGPYATLGVVGVGNVGRVVVAVARSLGYRVLCCDPPRALAEGSQGFVSLEELLVESDIVTMHVPLNARTQDMADDRFFNTIRSGATFLNSSRGEVVDEKALVDALKRGHLGHAAIDVWRGEPTINPKLLALATIATPHIAGYSLQGKAMGTAMAVRAVAHTLSLPIHPRWYPKEDVQPTTPRTDLSWDEITRRMVNYYDIMSDDSALRAVPSSFESLREGYSFRDEFF